MAFVPFRDLGTLLVGFGLFALACGAPDDPRYGAPGSIKGRTPPAGADNSTTGGGGTAGGTDATSGGGSTGTAGTTGTTGTTGDAGTGGGSDGGGGGTTANAGLCSEATFVGDPSCAVKWSVDLYPKINGAWSCGNVICHGGTSEPAFTTTDSKTTWDFFRNHKGAAGKPYINPCSKDPAASYIVGNFNGTVGMIMPSTGSTAEEKAAVKTWVECGAPFN